MVCHCWESLLLKFNEATYLRAFGSQQITKTLLWKRRNVSDKVYRSILFLSEEKYILKDSVNVHWRDPKYAQDKSTSIDAVQEFLRNHSHIQNLALIQCTSPFISHRYLQEAFQKFSFHRDCVFAAVRSYKLRWKRDDSQNVEKIVPINFDYRKRPRRQDWNGELIEAGMFYFAKRKLLDDRLFQNEK